MPHTLTHPTRDTLTDFLAGRLALAEQRGVEAHVATCDECCRVLETLPEDTLVVQLKGDATPFPPHPPRPTRLEELPIPDELKDHPRYEVQRAIGAGGMGVAYLAVHRRMDRPVVLKVIHRELMANPVAVRRFQVEVKAAARLGHPNIVQAHDADEAGALHFLVMEYVEGASLAALVAKRGPLPPAYAANYIRQAAAGLQHAHERGMVHRDIKPQNLMLTPAGQIKVLDFGLAQFARDVHQKSFDEGDDTVPLSASHRTGTIVTGSIITGAGAVFGTPDYIAPEQAASSHDVDIRADIYSLGCTFYYLLRGEPPFAGGSAQEKLAAHQERPIPSLAGGAEPLGDDIAAIVRRMMAKAPEDRFQTPAEVVQALTAFAKSSRKVAPPPVPPPVVVAPPVVAAREQTSEVRGQRTEVRSQTRRREWVWIAAAVVVVVGGLVAVRNWPASKPAGQPIAVTPAATARMPTVLVLLSPSFPVSDYIDVRRALEHDGKVSVRVAATGPCRPYEAGKQDIVVQPDVTLPDTPLRAVDYDAIYIPGGNIFSYKDDTPSRRAVWKLIDELLAANKPVAALGQGQAVLAIKGTLAGRKVSGHSGVRQFMASMAGTDTGEKVTVDGPIITAADNRAATLLARTLLDEMRRRGR